MFKESTLGTTLSQYCTHTLAYVHTCTHSGLVYTAVLTNAGEMVLLMLKALV